MPRKTGFRFCAKATLGGIGQRQAPRDQLRPIGAPGWYSVIVKIIFRVMYIGTVAIADKDIRAGAFFQHIGEIFAAHDKGRICTITGDRTRRLRSVFRFPRWCSPIIRIAAHVIDRALATIGLGGQFGPVGATSLRPKHAFRAVWVARWPRRLHVCGITLNACDSVAKDVTETTIS